MCFSPQRRAFFRRLKSKKCFGADVFCTFWLANVLFATAAYNFSTSERTKVVQTRHVLYILTCKCASRHSRVPFLNIGNSKISPRLWCFAHFDLQMCFSPQRRAINFWFLRWQHDSAPAAVTGLLFDWPDTRIIEKTQHFATSLTFRAHVSSFF